MDVTLFYCQQKVVMDALDELDGQDQEKRKRSEKTVDVVAVVSELVQGLWVNVTRLADSR